MSKKLPCPKCPSSDAYVLYEDGGHCFSCGYKQFKKSLGLSKRKSLLAPNGLRWSCITDLPLDAKAWLYKHRIFDEFRDWYQINWSDVLQLTNSEGKEITWLNRMCIGIRDINNKETIGVIARSFNEDPKYVTQYPKDTLFYGRDFLKHKQKWVVITEDIFSTIRVNEIMPALSILGCKVSGKSGKLLKLLDLNCNFIIWLDGDRPGQEGAIHLKKQLEQFRDCVIIKTDKDPKCYSNDQIKQILKGYNV